MGLRPASGALANPALHAVSGHGGVVVERGGPRFLGASGAGAGDELGSVGEFDGGAADGEVAGDDPLGPRGLGAHAPAPIRSRRPASARVPKAAARSCCAASAAVCSAGVRVVAGRAVSSS